MEWGTVAQFLGVAITALSLLVAVVIAFVSLRAAVNSLEKHKADRLELQQAVSDSDKRTDEKLGRLENKLDANTSMTTGIATEVSALHATLKTYMEQGGK